MRRRVDLVEQVLLQEFDDGVELVVLVGFFAVAVAFVFGAIQNSSFVY